MVGLVPRLNGREAGTDHSGRPADAYR